MGDECQNPERNPDGGVLCPYSRDARYLNETVKGQGEDIEKLFHMSAKTQEKVSDVRATLAKYGGAIIGLGVLLTVMTCISLLLQWRNGG